jgi:hypothetical protein
VSAARRGVAQYRRFVDARLRAGVRWSWEQTTRRHPAVLDYRAHGGARFVIVEGDVVEHRTSTGRLVYADHQPDYLVPYRVWAKLVWARPVPLPRSLRGKLRGAR